MKAEEIVDALIELRDIRGWTNYRIAVESNLPASTVSNFWGAYQNSNRNNNVNEKPVILFEQ